MSIQANLLADMRIDVISISPKDVGEFFDPEA